MKTNNIKRFNCNFFINPVYFFGFLSCFLFQIPFSYLCFLPGIQLCFLFNINVLGFKKHKLKNVNFWSKRGVAPKQFLLITCVLQNVKSYRFPPFGQILVDVQKHYKNRYFSTFSKAKKRKNDHIEGLLSGPSKGYYLGQVCCNIKNGQLGPDNNPSYCCAHSFFKKKVLKPLFYSVFFLQTVLKKTNLAQRITLQMAKLGPDNNSTAYLYIRIHTGCCP